MWSIEGHETADGWIRGGARDRVAPPTIPSSEPQRWHISTLRFLCEQSGEREIGIKQALRPLLVSRPAVTRAYLARVDYGDAASYEVALCISGPTDEALVREVAATFRLESGFTSMSCF